MVRQALFIASLFYSVLRCFPLDDPADIHVFNESRVAAIRVTMSTNDFRTMLSSRRAPGPEAIHQWVAATVDFDGIVLSNVAMRIKGNNSLWIAPGLEIPYKLDFNRFVPKQDLHGVKMLNLHSFATGYLTLSDFLSYGAFRAEGIPAPRTGWADLWLNGRNLGTYTTVEQVGQSFIDRHFKFNHGDLYKAEEPFGNLGWVGTNMADYPTLYPELQEGSDHSSLIHFLDVINHRMVAEYPTVLDLKLTLAYFAGNSALGNRDAYPGIGHNYYLYESAPGKFGFLPWDMNLSQEGGSKIVPTQNRFTSKLLGDATNRQVYYRVLLKFLEGGASKEALNQRIDAAISVLGSRLDSALVELLRQNILRRLDQLLVQLFSNMGPSPFPSVEISEILASNRRAVQDDFGEFEDYIELSNRSEQAVDLAGMYLSDEPKDPKKFQFLPNSLIPPWGYLVLWADGEPQQGRLHLPFQLAARGETLMLSDIDARANFVLDTFTFQNQREDIAEGRLPGQFFVQGSMAPTPGKPNRMADSDSDGLPDAWEWAAGLDMKRDDGFLDLDNDGVTNLLEFEKGTDPTSGTSAFRLGIAISNKVGVSLSWPRALNAIDLLDASTNLSGPWEAIDALRAPSNSVEHFVPPFGNRFYRLRRFVRP